MTRIACTSVRRPRTAFLASPISMRRCKAYARKPAQILVPFIVTFTVIVGLGSEHQLVGRNRNALRRMLIHRDTCVADKL